LKNEQIKEAQEAKKREAEKKKKEMEEQRQAELKRKLDAELAAKKAAGGVRINLMYLTDESSLLNLDKHAL